jgi:hypothetical protein
MRRTAPWHGVHRDRRLCAALRVLLFDIQHHSMRGKLSLRALMYMDEGESCRSWELNQLWPRETPASNPLARLSEPRPLSPRRWCPEHNAWPHGAREVARSPRKTSRETSSPPGRDKALGILEGSRRGYRRSIRKGLLRPRATE